MPDEAASCMGRPRLPASNGHGGCVEVVPGAVEWATLLACKKCQKKLKKTGGMKQLAKLRRSVRKHEGVAGVASPHVVDVECMDLCPKGGVAVYKPGEMGARLYVVRSVEDVFGI